jgi:hypothetical protein
VKINVKYSLEQDTESVKSLLTKADFFSKNKYALNLPDGLKMGDVFTELTQKTIQKEYSGKESRYAEVKSEIEDAWGRHGEEITSFLKLFDYLIPDLIEVELISYGPGGGYTPPDTVSVMVEKPSKNTYLDQVIHEIIHLIFEKPIVIKYDLNQRQKENLVESMYTHSKLKSVFPSHLFHLNFSMPEKQVLDKIAWR